MRNQHVPSQQLITAIFWELFSLGSAVSALLRSGFTEADIDAFGVLSGSAPDLRGFLESVGVPRVDSTYCNECFQDGAVLLMIRTQAWKRHIAVDVVRRHGGCLPPSQ